MITTDYPFKNKFLSLFLTVFFLIFFSSISFSQIVNIEKKRKDSNGFQATMGFDFNIKQSGSKILELKNNIDLQYNLNAHAFILLNDIQLLSVDNGSLINNGFQHFRYNYTIKDSSFVTLEAFGQYQYNEQKLLQQRILGALGPRFRILNKEKIKWYTAPLAMYEYEDLNQDEIELFEADTARIRLDAYTNFFTSLNDLLSFNLVAYYQPDLGNFNDYRVSGETNLTINITKYLAYRVGFSADYDSDPPPPVQSTFWYFKNALIFKL
jgi:hypothetical protein